MRLLRILLDLVALLLILLGVVAVSGSALLIKGSSLAERFFPRWFKKYGAAGAGFRMLAAGAVIFSLGYAWIVWS